MAEKEERIVLLVTKPKGECPCQIDKDYCKETCWVKGKCSLGMSRQEAIERMAKGIHFYEWGHHNNMPKWNELNSDIQNDYRNMAEAALNALLSGDK